jgi:hypothetical protein
LDKQQVNESSSTAHLYSQQKNPQLHVVNIHPEQVVMDMARGWDDDHY